MPMTEADFVGHRQWRKLAGLSLSLKLAEASALSPS